MGLNTAYCMFRFAGLHEWSAAHVAVVGAVPGEPAGLLQICGRGMGQELAHGDHPPEHDEGYFEAARTWARRSG